MASEKRFIKVYTQGVLENMEIWVDTQTGVNYLYHAAGNSGGLTPLLNAQGEVVVKKPPREEL